MELSSDIMEEEEVYFSGKTEDAPTQPRRKKDEMLYVVDDKPGWILSFLLAVQHCFLSVDMISVPLVFAPLLCMKDDEVGYLGKAMVINSLLFVSGIMTIVQTTFGVRLPIMQGASSAFVSSSIALLKLPHNRCPEQFLVGNFTDGISMYNDTDDEIVDGTELWQRRMRELQGALAVSSLVEIALSVTGATGFLMRFIGPLTVAPSIALIGLSLTEVAANNASGHWGIAVLTFGLLVVFSQYMKEVKVPLLLWSKKKKFHTSRFNVFKIFPVLISVVIACGVCVLLTFVGVFPDDPEAAGYRARTDVKLEVLHSASWVHFSYPGQWGMPVVTSAGVIGMIVSVIISMVESIGDYHACARICQAPSPPTHAFNRGLAMEGFGSLLSALVGTSTGTTSYSQNIAAIGITRVASRRVLQTAGAILIVIGMIGKFGALVVVIPDPVMGGLFCVMFGMITAVGLANLQFVDLNSTRNLVIVGFSIFMGLTVPTWLKKGLEKNSDLISTGSTTLDQILTVLLGTQLFIGFFLAVVLDNTIPGTPKERGMTMWTKDNELSDAESKMNSESRAHCYDLPFKTNCCRFSRYIPILPEFGRKRSNSHHE